MSTSLNDLLKNIEKLGYTVQKLFDFSDTALIILKDNIDILEIEVQDFNMIQDYLEGFTTLTSYEQKELVELISNFELETKKKSSVS